MIDATTQKPLTVSNPGTAGPYLRLPFSQLDEVCRLFDKHGIRYWVEENVFSLDGGPEIAYMTFGRRGDAHLINAILGDAAPSKDVRNAG